MKPTAQEVLSILAMIIMGGLSALLAFHAVPQQNTELVTFALGAISGALTVGGGSKVADKVTNSTGAGAIIQPEAETK